MISVGIVGASGYGGLELINLLLRHPQVTINKLFGDASAGKSIDAVHPSLRTVCALPIEDFSAASLEGLDLVFFSLSAGKSMSLLPIAADQGCRIIDLAGDFRLPDVSEYKRFYGQEHTAPEWLPRAAYGLSEWNSAAVSSAQVVANPGCYPTSILLTLLPLLKAGLIDAHGISVAAYSGTSGAGKAARADLMHSEVNESVRAYRVGTHQHTPEIAYYLEAYSATRATFSFVPHLLPATRGIYTTIYASARQSLSDTLIGEAYLHAYENAPFVRLTRTTPPEMQHVQHTNFCDIGWWLEPDGRRLVLMSTLDNLGKGAAGQAVQNMNIMFGFPQTEGLLPCTAKP